MASIQGIYVALFGRPADPSGLAYFNGVTKNGADLRGIGDLTKTSEYQSRFTGMSNEQVVNSIYKSLFGRDGEKTGIDFFLAKLASGELTINNIAIAILDGAQGDDLVTVKAKIDAANIFTSHLDLQLEIDAYRGNTAAQIGRDFITAVTKTDPGTGEEADAAILKLLQNQGQAPGGTGGSDGSSGGTPLFFKIYNHAPVETLAKSAASYGITFESNATGAITLGQSIVEHEAPQLKFAVFSEFPPEPQEPSALLTGDRGGTVATFPNGPIDTTDGVHIASKALPEGVSLQLKDNLHVTMDAETASDHQISGTGSVCISGSDGTQTILVAASGSNFIEGGLDADVIKIDGASSGVDTIRINGVTDGETRDAIASASAARDAVETRDALNAAKDDVTAAEKAVDKANVALGVATVTDKIAETLSDAVGKLDFAIKALFAFAFDSRAITKAISGLESLIETSNIIPADLKAKLLDAIPNDSKDFKVTSFLDKFHSAVDAYKQEADDAKDHAQDVLDKAKSDLSGAKIKRDALAETEDQHQNREKTDADLAQAKTTAESAVDALKNNIHTDSKIGGEDKISGFEFEKDHLNLPGHDVVQRVSNTSFTFEGHSYSVTVKDGIGHVTENGVQSVSIKLSGSLLDAALQYLSDDHVAKQGETVAFDYMDGNETGLYVFQGGDYGSDIGVKLVGLHAPDTTTPGHGLAELLGFSQPV